MKKMLKDIIIEISEPIIIYYDNTSRVSISKNPILYSKTKHISIKYQRERSRKGDKIGVCKY